MMAELGKGPAKALTDGDLERAAVQFGVHPAALEAIATVESAGFGWFRDGRIKILPEPHWFNKYLTPEQRREANRQQLIAGNNYKRVKAAGHYRRMKSAAARYNLLKKWIAINEEAAFKAISMGTYQIMGFNHKEVGFRTAKGMFEAFLLGEAQQLRAFITFLQRKDLKVPIQKLQWHIVEKRYNGGGQGGDYARKMKREYEKLIAGKWKNWKSSDMEPVSPQPPEKIEEGPVKTNNNFPPPPKPKPKPSISGPTKRKGIGAKGYAAGLAAAVLGILALIQQGVIPW